MNRDFDIKPFPNVGNSIFYNEFHVGNMLPNVGLNGTVIRKSTLDSEQKKDEERNDTDMIYNDNLVDDMMASFFGESTKGGDPEVPDKIEPIISTLEAKGYKVKYASPGYKNTRFNNDKNKDGVINAKLQGTARIIFERNYKFPNTPKGWTWKVLDNGIKALYAKPLTYNQETMGTKENAFKTWQDFYMDSLKDWVTELPHMGTVDETKSDPDKNFK